MRQEPLVLLGGHMCDARIFGPQISEFSKDRMVVVPPVMTGRSVPEYIRGLLDQLPAKFAVAGYDLGGFGAMELLHKVPDRVTRIALISTNALADTPQESAAREADITKARAGCGHMVIEERSLAAIGSGAERAGALQILRDMAMGLGPDVMVEQLRAIQKRSDQQSTLRKCRVPAALICGELGPLAQPKRPEFMATLIHYATLHVIPNAGHYPTLEQPDMINAAMREWLVQPMVLR